MLLSHRYKFLFIHIAKTGGTSVRAALERYRWREPARRLGLFLCSRISSLSGHRLGVKLPRHARAVAALEMLPHGYFQELFRFAFVRNPWDLQVSSFHHIRRERPHLMGEHRGFEDFLRWKLDPERPYQYHLDTSIALQSDYLVDLHGEMIVDFVGCYENLAADFEEACRRIGLRSPGLPHRRQADDRSNDYRSYYTDTTAQLVAEHFSQDIACFGYRFDGVGEPGISRVGHIAPGTRITD